jgi:5-methyltetrahydropteroyltriglutamate--homocysteine methyltransferase
MKLRGKNVLLPTTMVGKYPNPRWWDAHYARFFQGHQEPPDSMMREALEDAINAIVRDQEIAGLDIVCDGRLWHDSYAEAAVYYYHKRLGCIQERGGFLGFPIYSRLRTVTCDKPIKRYGQIMVEQARALKRATEKPVKISYMGIQVLAQAINDEHYESSRDRALNIAKAVNEDILELDALGIDFIQIDEFTWPYFLEDWAIEAFDRATEGVKNAKIVCHTCWGNWGGTPGYLPDETAQPGEIFDISKRAEDAEKAQMASVVPQAYQSKNMNVLNIENCGRRHGDFSGLDVLKDNPLPANMVLWAGVIDVKSTVTETAEQVAGRIRRLLQVVPAEQLGISTDCGLGLLQRYIAQDKLHALVAGTQLVRAELREKAAE